MKKLVLMSAMALFLSSMAAQAQSTISWDFDTVGDTEGWIPSHDPSMTEGLVVTNGFDSVVLTTPDVTGGDPGVLMDLTNSVPSGEYWDTLEVRMRAVTQNGGAPMAYYTDGTVMVLNWVIVNGPIGGIDWVVDEASVAPSYWFTTTYDITEIGTNDITFLRIDPPASPDTRNFEIDYIKLHTHTNAPPPTVYKTDWEFNTPGDTEGWTDNMNGNVEIATAASGPESVLTITDASGTDPQTFNNTEQANLEPGLYWSTAELRIRHLVGGVPQAWDPAGTLFLLAGQVLSHTIGGSGWDTTSEANGWITTRLDISGLGGNIFSMRVDPFESSGGKTFEIDYLRFETRSTPILPPAPSQLAHTWEFNTLGDTEGFTHNGRFTGLTVANGISNLAIVLTSSDVTADDPMLFFNELANPALNIIPPGPWETMEVRMRHLSGNPGVAGTAPIAFDTAGALFQVNGKIINLGTEVLSFVAETDGSEWINAVFDISSLGHVDLTYMRLDPLSAIDDNFEIDWIKVSSQGSKYDAWSQVVYELEGADAEMTADPDEDTFDNLYEYAFGGDPTNSADVGLVEDGIAEDGGTAYFEYIYMRRTDSNNGLTYDLQLKDALNSGSWISLGDSAEAGTFKAGDDHEVVTNLIEAVDSEKFFNLEVTGE